MYCPWDVLQYVRSVLDGSYSEVMGPESYWLNTSETAPVGDRVSDKNKTS